jgi:hypothetical protein
MYLCMHVCLYARMNLHGMQDRILCMGIQGDNNPFNNASGNACEGFDNWKKGRRTYKLTNELISELTDVLN